MHELLVEGVAHVTPLVEALGVLVVLWGVVQGLLGLIRRSLLVLTGKAAEPSIARIRLMIGEKMALGLDIFLAGDVIQTIVVPSWESLGILGGIVVIRTVLAFFLHRDLKEIGHL